MDYQTHGPSDYQANRRMDMSVARCDPLVQQSNTLLTVTRVKVPALVSSDNAIQLT